MPARRALLSIPALLLATPVAAQEVPPPGPPVSQPPEAATSRDRFTIGLAVAVSPSYNGSDDYRVTPGGLLQGSIDGFDFAARGTNLYVDLLREPPGSKIDFVAGPVIQGRFERNSGIRDRQVSALGKIKPALELGGYVGIGRSGLLNPFDKLSFDITYVADVSGIHNSTIITPSVTYFTPLSRRNAILLTLSADHVGRKFGQTYFDVPTAANASVLAPYGITRAGWKNVGGGALFVQALGPDIRKGWSVFGFGGYSKILGQYARSPIVRDAGTSDQFIGFAGLAYSF